METVEPSVTRQNRKIEIQTNITAQICNFSNKDSAENEIKKRLSVEEFDELILECSIFYSRGYFTIEMKLHLKLKFQYQYPIPVDSFCSNSSVSVIDAAGEKRYTTTVSKHDNNRFGIFDTSVSIDKYLSRQTLLNDPTELLPNDILTLEIDIYLAFDSDLSSDPIFLLKHDVEGWIADSIDKTDSGFKLFLDSEMAKTLREISTFFRDIFAYTPGDKSEYLEIPGDDTKALIRIFKMVKGVEYNIVNIIEVFELLRVSDKYDILNLPEICRLFFKEFCGNNMLSPEWKEHGILELLMSAAHRCRDTTVLELVGEFVQRENPSFELKDNGDYGFNGLELIYCPALLDETCSYEPSFGFKLTTNIISSNCYYN